MTQTLATRIVAEDLIVGVGGDSSWGDADFQMYMSQLGAVLPPIRASGTQLSVLMFAGYQGPDARQRSALSEITRDAAVRVATITRSPIARFVLTAFAWLGSTAKGFRPEEIGEAISYLGLSHDYVEMALAAARSMASGMGGSKCVEDAMRCLARRSE